jgi:D-serine deaminase-like pyridoxal phosphate-dependent protein
VVSGPKLERLLWVADHADRFATLVDCPGNVRPLADVAARQGTTVGVIIEVDVGVERMGVAPGEGASELAALIAEEPALEFRGILGHDSHVPAAGKTVSATQPRSDGTIPVVALVRRDPSLVCCVSVRIGESVTCPMRASTQHAC